MATGRLKRAALAASMLFLTSTSGCAPMPAKKPATAISVKKAMEGNKPAPETRIIKKEGPPSVRAGWARGKCRIENGGKLVYTYRGAEGGESGEEMKSMRLVAVSGRPLAMLCSEQRTVILWSNGLELTNGADGVYLGDSSGASWQGSKALFRVNALSGLLEETGSGVQAVFVRADAKFARFKVHWGEGKDRLSTFSIDDSLDGKILRDGSVGRFGKCYTVSIRSLGRRFNIMFLENGNAGVDEALPGKPLTPECFPGERRQAP